MDIRGISAGACLGGFGDLFLLATMSEKSLVGDGGVGREGSRPCGDLGAPVEVVLEMFLWGSAWAWYEGPAVSGRVFGDLGVPVAFVSGSFRGHSAWASCEGPAVSGRIFGDLGVPVAFVSDSFRGLSARAW